VSDKQDAQAQLALAGQTAPAEALRQFLGQQGVTAGRTDQSPINGNSAARGTFTAQTQDGTQLAGEVAFLSYGGATYQLLGITTGAGWRAYAGVFDQFIGSFRRLTDPAALNVRPNRVSVVKVPRAMTLADFNRQYPSVIEIDKLALINGLADGDAKLAQGDLVKRVVTR